MKLNARSLAAGASLAALFLTASGQAQPIVAEHYPAGAEGLKAASLPPPGLYLRDYNFFYGANKFIDGPPGFEIFGYINAPRLVWMTPVKILGADYGMDVIVPFGYMNYKLPDGWHDYFGLGDIEVEPLLLSWHLNKFDFSAGYAFWAPTGDYSTSRPDMLAQGFWSHMITLGATWYPDAEKTISVSILNRYEIGYEQQDTHHTPGQVYTLEAGIGKTVIKNLDVGVIGYYQQQTTTDSGAKAGLDTLLDRKFGVGPEVSGFCPALGIFASLRYAYEFEARDRPQGQLIELTLTKRF